MGKTTDCLHVNRASSLASQSSSPYGCWAAPYFTFHLSPFTLGRVTCDLAGKTTDCSNTYRASRVASQSSSPYGCWAAPYFIFHLSPFTLGRVTCDLVGKTTDCSNVNRASSLASQSSSPYGILDRVRSPPLPSTLYSLPATLYSNGNATFINPPVKQRSIPAGTKV